MFRGIIQFLLLVWKKQSQNILPAASYLQTSTFEDWVKVIALALKRFQIGLCLNIMWLTEKQFPKSIMVFTQLT